MAKAEKFALKVTSAITLDGGIVTAGTVIEVDEKTARNLLHRGKAELAAEKPKKAAPKKTAKAAKVDEPASEPAADEAQAEG